MRKTVKLAAGGVCAAAFVMAIAAFAETSVSPSVSPLASPSGSPKPTLKEKFDQRQEQRANAFQQQQQNKLDALKQRQEKQAEIKTKIEDRAKEMVKKLYASMKARLQMALNRLEKIANRLDERIAKLEAGGANVATVKQKMIAVRADIAQGKLDLANADTTMQALIADQVKPKEKLAKVKEVLATFMERLKKIQRTEIDITVSLKGMSPIHSGASVTPAVSVSPSVSVSTSPIPTVSPSATPAASL